MLLLHFLPVTTPGRAEDVIRSFSDGEKEIILAFSGEGTETLTFEMPVRTRLVESGMLMERLRELALSAESGGQLPNLAGAESGDYDVDGDTDIVIFTAGPDDILLLVNQGDGTFVRENVPNGYSALGGALGDADNDGDLDMAVMGNGDNRLYTWNGDRFTHDIEFGNATSRCACWGDINNDGWPDLVVGNQGENQLYVRFGDGYQSALLFGEHKTNSVACGDIDNDGLLDVVVGNEGPDYFFRNLGTGQFSQVMLAGSGNTNSISLSDMNGDGRPEILAGMEGNNRIYWYQGPGAFDHTELESSLSTTSLLPSDLNLDGHMDLVEGNWGGENRILLSDGEGDFATGPELGWGATVELLPGDFDRDGDPDVMALNSNDRWELYRSGFCTDLRITVDVGADTHTDAEMPHHFPGNSFNSEFGTLNTTACAWGDYDNDGDPDLAIGNYGGQNFLYTNDGRGNFIAMLQFASGLPLSMDWGDYDRDGDLDLAVGNNGQNHLFTNTGSGFDQRSDFGGGYSTAVKWTDANVDGKPDLVAVNYLSDNGLYINRGTYFEESKPFGGGNSVSLAVGDYDSDGDPDVAIGKMHSEPNKLFVNQGDATFIGVNKFGSRSILSMKWGDLDRDGDLDLVSGVKDGNNAVHINNEGVFQETAGPGVLNAVTMELTDYDLDGCLDVVAASLSGEMECYLGDGEGGFDLDKRVELNLSITSMDVARADGDAYPDLALVTTSQNLYCPNSGDTLILRNMKGAVNEHVVSREEDEIDGNVSVPITVSSDGQGRIRLSQLELTYTVPPGCHGIPSIFSLEEDTMDETVCDLSTFFYDDMDRSTDLLFSVAYNSLEGIIGCYIDQGRYLAVDAFTGHENDNFTGLLELRVKAADSSNLSVTSDPFTVTISDVNDPPVPKRPMDDIVINESETFRLDLADGRYFVDGDGDDLFFDALLDPMNEAGGSRNTSVGVEDGILEIETDENSTFRDVPLWIFADDDEDVNMIGSSTDFVSQTVNLTILDRNDPPVLRQMDDVIMSVGQDRNDAFNVEDYVIDSDTPGDELTIKVEELSDEENFDVKVDWNHFVDIKLKKLDHSGVCTVRLSVSDGEYTAFGHFDIIVRERNSPPTCSLILPRDGAIIPTSSVELMWEGDDEDGDSLRYNIYFSRSSSGGGFHREDHKETSIIIDGLLDDTTYYWQVFPEDALDEGKCLDSMFSFTVDLDVDVPRVTLLFPENGAEIRAATATLSWSLDYPGRLPVTYEVLFYNTSERPRSYISDYGEEHIVVSSLQRNTSYHWTVIPRAGNIQGECSSGTYRFSVPETPEDTYPIELQFEGGQAGEAVVSAVPGERTLFNVTLHNRLTERRTVILVADGHPTILGSLQFQRETFVLQPPGAGNVYYPTKIFIDLPDEITGGKYLITLRAIANDVPVSSELEVILEVTEPKVSEPPEMDGGSKLWIIPVASVCLLISIILFVFIARRKARKLAGKDDPSEQGGATEAYSLKDGAAIEVDTVRPPDVKVGTPERNAGHADVGRMAGGRYAGRYPKEPPAAAFQAVFPIVHGSPYGPDGTGTVAQMGSNAGYMTLPGVKMEELKRGTREYVDHVSGIVETARAEGADTTDAEKLLEDAVDEFEEANDPGDYRKVMEYCSAAGNAVNRALSRMKKGK